MHLEFTFDDCAAYLYYGKPSLAGVIGVVKVPLAHD